MTVLGSFAALFLKKASVDIHIKVLLSNVNFYIGGGLYFLSAVINIYVLKFLPYSVVLPITSVTYIWTMLLSFYILKENISTKKIVGLILIIFGVGLVALPL